MRIKVYVAGQLFTEADRRQRLYEGQKLKQFGIDYYSPIENNSINDKSLLPTAKEVFAADLAELEKCNFILVDLANADPGTMMELGIAIGQNNGVRIIAHNSDIRIPTADKYSGIFIPYGYNQFVIGGILEHGQVYKSADEAIEIINQYHKKESNNK